jgi:DNA-binding MarR family transcriptional regulator
VQRIANELVGDGLASFADNPRHRRSQFLRITAAGQRVLESITTLAGVNNTALLEDVRGIDVVALRSALQQLTAAVRTRLGVDDLGS